MQAIHALPQPVIAQVHGIATAAGCQLVAACDLAVAAEDARFATPGVRIGLFCSTPMVEVVARRRAQAGDAAAADRRPDRRRDRGRLGPLNARSPPEALDDAVAALAARIGALQPAHPRDRQARVLRAHRPAAARGATTHAGDGHGPQRRDAPTRRKAWAPSSTSASRAGRAGSRCGLLAAVRHARPRPGGASGRRGPTSAISVSAYGQDRDDVGGDAGARLQALPSACEKPNSSAAREQRRTGCHLPKMSAARAMNPRPAVMFSLNEAEQAERQVGAAQAGQHAARDDGQVAHAVDVDADGVRGARVLADRAQAQAPRRAEDEEPGQDDEDEPQPDHQVHVADDVADERDVLEQRQPTVGMRSIVGRALGAVDRAERRRP